MTETETCPVCGEEYDNYFEERRGAVGSLGENRHMLRSDAVACKMKEPREGYNRYTLKFYVHIQ